MLLTKQTTQMLIYGSFFFVSNFPLVQFNCHWGSCHKPSWTWNLDKISASMSETTIWR